LTLPADDLDYVNREPHLDLVTSVITDRLVKQRPLMFD